MAEEGGYLHEAQNALTRATLDNHRAYRSLMEEIEAIDWYAQRIDATDDADLKAVLAHNRDEEKEHAAMVLEWLRRRDPVLDRHLRTYLFTSAPITEVEERVEAADGDEDAAPRLRQAGGGDRSLGIGSLRDRTP